MNWFPRVTSKACAAILRLISKRGDYIGSLDQFRAEFAVQAAIAAISATKISLTPVRINFRFPIVGELTGALPPKTSGTTGWKPCACRDDVACALPGDSRVRARTFAERNLHPRNDRLTKVPALDTLRTTRCPRFSTRTMRPAHPHHLRIDPKRHDDLGERFRPALEHWVTHQKRTPICWRVISAASGTARRA
jgi:hypothetical protein